MSDAAPEQDDDEDRAFDAAHKALDEHNYPTHEHFKERRAAYETIARGWVARRRGVPREDNPYRDDRDGENAFWPRHWLRGWELADQGKRLRFSMVREKKQ